MRTKDRFGRAEPDGQPRTGRWPRCISSASMKASDRGMVGSEIKVVNDASDEADYTAALLAEAWLRII